VPLTSGIGGGGFARTTAVPLTDLPEQLSRSCFPRSDGAGTVNFPRTVAARMSDTGGDRDELAEIRERKRERLRERIDGDGTTAAATGEREGTGDAPGVDEPVRVNGKAHLDTLVSDHDVVLVDFQADWCGPCQMLEPIVERIAASTDAVVASVDVDANGGLAGQYGVQGVPTLFLFVDGEPVERLVGMQEEGTLRGLIDEYA
jgi:thioredoxin 1